jgi:hypothetical protein
MYDTKDITSKEKIIGDSSKLKTFVFQKKLSRK